MLLDLGAHEALDYTQVPFPIEGRAFDVVLDVVGRMPISHCMANVAPGGAYVRGTVPGAWEVLVALGYALFSEKRVVLGDAGETPADLRFLVQLVADGTIRSVIDRRWPLAEAREAHAYLDRGHKKGHLLLEMVPTPEESPGSPE